MLLPRLASVTVRYRQEQCERSLPGPLILGPRTSRPYVFRQTGSKQQLPTPENQMRRGDATFDTTRASRLSAANEYLRSTRRGASSDSRCRHHCKTRRHRSFVHRALTLNETLLQSPPSPARGRTTALPNTSSCPALPSKR